MDTRITDGLVILGKITAILLIIGGVLFGLTLIAYGMMSSNFKGGKTLANVSQVNCTQKLDLMMKPHVSCDLDLAYKVGNTPMKSTFKDIPKDAISTDYPLAIQYEEADPSKISLIVMDKKNSMGNIVMGILILLVSLYLGMWLYNTDSLTSLLGIGQLGRFIVA